MLAYVAHGLLSLDCQERLEIADTEDVVRCFRGELGMSSYFGPTVSTKFDFRVTTRLSPCVDSVDPVCAAIHWVLRYEREAVEIEAGRVEDLFDLTKCR